jgi:hypothetical protein
MILSGITLLGAVRLLKAGNFAIVSFVFLYLKLTKFYVGAKLVIFHNIEGLSERNFLIVNLF